MKWALIEQLRCLSPVAITVFLLMLKPNFFFIQAERVVSERGSCAVREPLFSHLFNLSSLYNSTADHFVMAASSGSSKLRFVMNVCGRLVSDCNPFDRTTICLEQEGEESLSYEDGSLVLDYTSTRKDVDNYDTVL
jgi:hypothetical protein